MQSLNDDMEELYRKAGDEYPLNTNNADWNKVLQGLQHAQDDLTEENKKKKNCRYLLLLLLLPVGFIIGRYIGNHNKVAVATTDKQVNTSAAPSGKAEPVIAVPGIAGKKTTEVGGKVSRSEKILDKNGVSDKVDPTSGSLFDAGNSSFNRSDNSFNRSDNLSDRSNSKNIEKNNQTFNNTNKATAAINETTGKNGDIKHPENMASQKTAAAETNAVNTGHSETGLHADTSANATKETGIQPAGNAVADNKKNIKKDQQTSKRKFYYSLVIGPDVSTVKFYRQSKVGYSLGLMLGYNINRKIAIEAGALWDRKNYYTNGDYLDTSKLWLPANSVVSKVDGYCNMIEIPVNIKYNIVTKRNHTWFVSAGLSSYLMKNEAYNITYKRYSQSYTKDYGYKNSSRDWFSIMNISAGYQTMVRKNTHLSIAPYIKLPLRGVGIGKLPITSTGIYVSLSRSVW